MWSSATGGPKPAGPCRRVPSVSGYMTGCWERLLAKSCKNRRATAPPEPCGGGDSGGQGDAIMVMTLCGALDQAWVNPLPSRLQGCHDRKSKEAAVFVEDRCTPMGVSGYFSAI